MPTPPKEYQITIHFFGFDKLTKVFRSAPHWLGDEVTKGMRQSALAVQRDSAMEAPVDTGRLRQSITTEIDRGVIPQWANIGPSVKYGKFVEFGRRPGSRPPPASALIPWMKRHGMPASGAFALARAIGRRGIKPNPFMARGFKSASRAVDRIWNRTSRAIELRWGRENG
jgi:phage gpG-like protein